MQAIQIKDIKKGDIITELFSLGGYGQFVALEDARYNEQLLGWECSMECYGGESDGHPRKLFIMDDLEGCAPRIYKGEVNTK